MISSFFGRWINAQYPWIHGLHHTLSIDQECMPLLSSMPQSYLYLSLMKIS